MKYISHTIILSFLFVVACQVAPEPPATTPLPQHLRIGFDIDDTILFSRDNFLKAPHSDANPDHLDFAWVNAHDSLYSVIIEPVAALIGYLRAQGHEIFFITARPGPNGDAVGRMLTRELGFPVIKNRNLFFAPKRYSETCQCNVTTKHEVMKNLGLHIFYGDADNDMVAASLAGIRGVRVVRDPRSVAAYSRNYFGDTRADSAAASPYDEELYQRFLRQGVGPYGETIYPIY